MPIIRLSTIFSFLSDQAGQIDQPPALLGPTFQLPLVFFRGAGAEMRQSQGMAVVAELPGVTLFGNFLTPVFFYVL